MGGYAPGTEAVHAMLALMICVSVIFLFFAVTGLGEKFHRFVPTVLKAGIIMGAAIAAFQSELDRLETLPVTLVTAWIVVLILMFSIPFKRLKDTKLKVILASNAILVGFIAAAIAGVISGEISFSIEWGIFVPQFGEMIATLTPWGVGFPSFEMIIAALPLALMVYILVFAWSYVDRGSSLYH
ncbi:hypothetical protein GCM10010965_24510 [Caldalkalibacillus thermarum]|nr:hypothetical protein GCM10010965_24510 [Caldalkalibacillus thermarum]